MDPPALAAPFLGAHVVVEVLALLLMVLGALGTAVGVLWFLIAALVGRGLRVPSILLVSSLTALVLGYLLFPWDDLARAF